MAINLQRLMLAATFLLSPLYGWAFDNYKEFKRDSWDFQLGTNFFYSEANYVDGSKQNLASGSHYQLWDMTLETRYVPRKNWSLFGMGNIGASESKNSVASRSNSTFNEMAVGMDFLAYADMFVLVPEVGVLFPIEKVDTSADHSLNSEGALQMWARATLQKNFGFIRAYGWLGYIYRDGGRSSLLPWGGGLQWRARRWKVGAEVFGSQSITDDKDTQFTSSRQAYLNTVNAGSYKFYSVNPSLVDSLAYATFAINPKWSLQANGGMTLTGNNSAAGYHVGGFLRYTFDMSEGYTPDTYRSLPTSRSTPKQDDAGLSSKKQVPQFQEKIDDGVNQEIFKARPTKQRKTRKLTPSKGSDFPVKLRPDSN